MRLIQAKVQCVKGVKSTGWVVPGRETTVIYGLPGSGVAQFLLAMQSINPVYEIQREEPFADHPDEWTQGQFTRRVKPEKKTAVIMVFAADRDLVQELENIDPDLLETDRIEVGRRLDYSRWITFVEISASTRWSEIKNQIHEISQHLALLDLAPPSVSGWSPDQMSGSDRIKGEVYTACREWLNAAAGKLPAQERKMVDSCLYKIERAERFQQARRTVEEWLPPTICLHSDRDMHSSYAFSDLFADNRSYDPVSALLRLLCKRYSLGASSGDGDGRESLIADAEKQKRLLQVLLPEGVAAPTIDADNEHILLGLPSLQSDFDKRALLAGTVCMLSVLACGHRPLLLLDRFDAGLSQQETAWMAGWLQQLGNHCQLFISTESEVLMEAEGWQKVLVVEPNGLEDGGFVAAQ